MSDRSILLHDRLLHDNIARDSASSRKEVRLLVVSSNKINRIVISRTAILVGLKSYETDPCDAGEALDRHCPQAVLIDCDGDRAACERLFEQIRAVRTSDRRPRVLVIERSENDCPHHVSAEADFLIHKPITTDRLGTALHSLIDG